MAAHAETIQKSSTKSAWKVLASHYKTISKLHLRQLFADDPKRGERFSAEAIGLYLDGAAGQVERLDALEPPAQHRERGRDEATARCYHRREPAERGDPGEHEVALPARA